MGSIIHECSFEAPPTSGTPGERRRGALFPLGSICATPGALDAAMEAGVDLLPYLVRHAIGDWSEMDAQDQFANQVAVYSGERIFSAYHLPNGVKIWVVTEADRSVTTVLLPDEY